MRDLFNIVSVADIGIFDDYEKNTKKLVLKYQYMIYIYIKQ